MWTAANRARMAAIEKKTRRYPTDLTDEEWSRPSGGILDSQSVEAPAPGAERAFDGAKKIVGRKRHIAGSSSGPSAG